MNQENKQNNIALLGFGTVGMGVYEILTAFRATDEDTEPISVKKILVRDVSKKRKIKIDKTLLTDDFTDVLNDDTINAVVCVMGGLEPEYTYIKQLLKVGKHVITANKEVIAPHIDELLSLARNNGVNLLFEASVGGGIPIISSMSDILRINKINKIQGILNGTTNFILTKITKEKRNFDDILREAQELGFAEADPSADVDGYDMSRKICILSSIAFRTVVMQEDVHLRGIGNITLTDIQMASEFGYNIKYIAQGILTDNGYSVSVTPVLLKNDQVLSHVNEEYNIILVEGDIIGKLCFMGKGAGKNATADAVVSDLMKALKNEKTYDNLYFNASLYSAGLDGIFNEYFIRVNINDHFEMTKTLNAINKVINKNKMFYIDGKLFLLTESIKSYEMKQLFEKLKTISTDVFYARIENNLL